MNLKFLFILIIGYSLSSFASDGNSKCKIFLTGASFATENNSWFELGCRSLNATPVNKAIGGESIGSTANRMYNGTLYSVEELEEMDAFVIMQVHNSDVFDETHLLPKYTDYTLPFERVDYAAAYDYVIKRYLTECYNLKDNPRSKYYGSKAGKPVIIILCTHWNDSREVYNTSIRKLAAKWGFPIVEFDKYVGFSKNTKHPVTGEHISVLYSPDTKECGSGIHGWHPNKGESEYIQQRMAAIFVDLMKKVLPIRSMPDIKK